MNNQYPREGLSYQLTVLVLGVSFRSKFYKYLTTFNLNVKLLVGVTFGSVLCALFASALLLDEKTENTFCEFYDLVESAKYSVTNVINKPVFNNHHKSRLLFTLFRDKKFGDVQTPMVIIVATDRGKPLFFKSWSEEHKHLLLYNLLDASTAYPAVFPMVNIEGIEAIDGGLISTQPIGLAYLFASILYNETVTQLFFISIGKTIENGMRDIVERTTTMIDEGTHRRAGILHFVVNGLLQQSLTNSIDPIVNPIIQDILQHRLYTISYPLETIIFKSKQLVIDYVQSLQPAIDEFVNHYVLS